MEGLDLSDRGFTHAMNGKDFHENYNDNMTTHSHEFLFADVGHYPDVHYSSYGNARRVLWTVVAPIIILIGTAGNLLTILVFSRSRLKGSSTAIYLSALAISDTLLLWCAPFGTWLQYAWSIELKALGEVGCRARLFASSTCLHLSSWILVAVTMERTISVVVPHKAKIYCSPTIAKIVLGVIFVLLVGCDLTVLLLGSVEEHSLLIESDELKCGATSFQEALLHSSHNIIGWVDLLVSYTIPFVFLFIGNILMIRAIHRCRKSPTSLRISRGTRGSRSKQKNTWSLTVLMIALCVAFLIAMTPVSVFHVYCPVSYSKIQELLKTDVETAWEDFQFLLLQRTIVNLVSYTNTSFNFLLYVLNGSKFREELKFLCCCRKRRQARDLNRSNYSETISVNFPIPDTCKDNHGKSIVNVRTKSMANFQQTNQWKEEFMIKRSKQEDAIEQCNLGFIDDYGSSISSILSTAQESLQTHPSSTDEGLEQDTLDSTMDTVQINEAWIYNLNRLEYCDTETQRASENQLTGFLLWI